MNSIEAIQTLARVISDNTNKERYYEEQVRSLIDNGFQLDRIHEMIENAFFLNLGNKI